jgi:glycosyltransferase involved in cell wall biosynthesis
VAEAQIPAKVFEAMAMAKPVVSTAVSDLPDILAGCGIIVEPENVAQLAGAIETVLADSQGADEIGERARERHRKSTPGTPWKVLARVMRQVSEAGRRRSTRATRAGT